MPVHNFKANAEAYSAQNPGGAIDVGNIDITVDALGSNNLITSLGGFDTPTTLLCGGDNLTVDLFGNLLTAGSIKCSSVAGIGYAAGNQAGGSQTQGSGSGKATGVLLNAICGRITMDSAALAGGAIVSFTLTNSAIAATDVIILNHISGGTVGAYTLNAQPAAGSATINVRNNTGGSLSEAIVIQYAVIKASIT